MSDRTKALSHWQAAMRLLHSAGTHLDACASALDSLPDNLRMTRTGRLQAGQLYTSVRSAADVCDELIDALAGGNAFEVTDQSTP